ncbi:MAG: NTF2 fold immunity protein [Janthinobacterium lividum]
MFVPVRSVVYVVLLVASSALAQTARDKEEFAFVRMQIAHSHLDVPPKAGMVPDIATATAIAYAIGVPVFGKKQMDDEQPFRADLKNGVWTVLGTIHCASCDGGTLIVQINRSDGKVLRLLHSQ